MPLTKKQISEIKGHLENAQNPLFLFDNDQDGLCSFLLLQRFIRRGKGFHVKNARSTGNDYIRKINEFNSDYVFILDVPEFSEEFFSEIQKMNLRVVWIDHHDIPKNKIPDFVNYYNPLRNRKKTNEPVTYLCWQIVGKNRKEDLWLGVVGCVADSFVPDFYKDFEKEFPELCLNSEARIKEAFDIFYGCEIGKIARIFGFAIKDSTTNVISMIKFLMKVKGPHDVLSEGKDNFVMHKRFEEIEKKYNSLMKKAKSQTGDSDRVVFFVYSGDMSMSSEISNGLKYFYPDKYIFVAYTKGGKVNISARGKNVREIVLRIIGNIDGATGGGHENAVGAQIRKEFLEKFEEEVREEIAKKF
jgi:single-stranded DNA-specific DHH superfamily exonuclease